MINFDYTHVLDEITEKEIQNNKEKTLRAFNTLINNEGLGNDFTGWIDLPLNINTGMINRIKEIALNVRKNNSCLVVIGIGGSYLGAKAAIDMLNSYYPKNDFQIIFLGNNLSQSYLAQTLEYLKSVDFVVNVISKSGKTLEPAIAFRMIKDLLVKKYLDKHNERVYVTTSSHNSLLHEIALKEHYEEFFIPDNVGGRYSVLTAVGLLPIACSGFDITKIIDGAKDAYHNFTSKNYENNACLQYASIRNLLYQKGKTNEILVSYEPKLKSIGEWWKQLFGESEGKDHKGIFPVTLTYSTDLHSVGQYVQDGLRNLFETVLDVEIESTPCDIIKTNDDEDGLNYLASKPMSFVKNQALTGTVLAHVSGGVSNMIITIKEISEYSFGYLVYFFMLACGVSGYLLGVNPFNQEGVEAYKKNMFMLLRK